MAELNLPSLPSTVDPAVRRAFQLLAEWSRRIETGTGTSTNTTIINQVGTAGGAGGPDLATPPTPTGFKVNGAFNAMVMEWDVPTYTSPVYAYTEVWRNSTDDLGNAVHVGSTFANVYTDVPPHSDTAQTYYYWIRDVSIEDVAGPYNASSGTPGTTADNPAHFLAMLAGSLGYDQFASGVYPVRVVAALPELPSATYPEGCQVYVTADNRMYRSTGTAWTDSIPTSSLTGTIGADQIEANAVTANKILAGAITAGKIAAGAIVAGDGVIGNAAIAAAHIIDGVITNAKIQNLAVDNAKIADAAITSVKIADAQITTAKIADTIQATNYSPGQYGWRITKAGTVEFNQGLFRGAVVFSSGSSGYGNLSDKPTSLSAISATDANTLSTAASTASSASAAAGTAQSTANTAVSNAATAQDTADTALANANSAKSRTDNWVKPNETTIDGNKIYTGDAYVDTLQIKGQAVTIPVSAYTAGSTGTAAYGTVIQTVTVEFSGSETLPFFIFGQSAAIPTGHLAPIIFVQVDGVTVGECIVYASSSGLPASLVVSCVASLTPNVEHTVTLVAGTSLQTSYSKRTLMCLGVKR